MRIIKRVLRHSVGSVRYAHIDTAHPLSLICTIWAMVIDDPYLFRIKDAKHELKDGIVKDFQRMVCPDSQVSVLYRIIDTL